MTSGLRRILLLIAAAALLATACGGVPAATTAEQSRDTRDLRVQIIDDLRNATAVAPAVAEWSNPDLPVPFSPLATAAGNVIYRTVDDGALNLVAVSASTGTEVWRQPIDPLGQLRGIAPAPLVFEDEGIVISPQYRFFGERLTAFDAINGEELWSEDVSFEALPAFRCGDDVCAHYEEVREHYDLMTGKRTRTSDAPHVDRIFATTSNYMFASGPWPTGVTEWVALHDGTDGALLWKVAPSEIEALTNVKIGPEFGWSAMIVEEENVVASFLGSNDADVSGVWTGFDLTTGEILWTYADQQACIFDDYAPDQIVVCRTDEAEQVIERIDFRSGEPEWSNRIGGPDEFLWTTALDRYVFTSSTALDLVFDIETGAVLDSGPLQLCGFSQPWQFLDVEWYDEPVDYRAATHPALCDRDFETITAAEATQTEPELAAAAHVQAGNGWSIAVSIDGELSGVYTE